ncbi:hypothetical protein F0562_010646, partial [Nyssa sinensis]
IELWVESKAIGDNGPSPSSSRNLMEADPTQDEAATVKKFVLSNFVPSSKTKAGGPSSSTAAPQAQ